ncbi:18250_t:CDS:2 [Racocetra persica]|uniref:18250_t:CDS:1 n=1 Tax=Racocetra persica TaxID=160502 RepID=A0ACA9NYR2_9GLOM|nr:18250_t:CDS:2 [Racocetra persica]
MVPQPIVTSDEKEQIRLSSLELRITEFENTFLRSANASLEKRVVELENSLKESTKECVKLREMIANGPVHRKKYFGKNGSGEPNYVKLVEDMKSEGVKAVNLKIPSVSNLPKFPAKPSPANNSRPGTPKNQVPIASSPARSRASSVSNNTSRSRASSISNNTSIPSRCNTPSSGIKIPSTAMNALNAVSAANAAASSPITSTKSQTPLKVQNLSSPNSHTSSRPTTPSNLSRPITPSTLSIGQNNSVNSVSHLNSKMPLRSRTPIWPSCSNSSRPSTPNSSNINSNTTSATSDVLNTHNIPNISITQSPLCNDITSNIPDVNSSVLAAKSTGIPMYAQMTRKQAIV